MSHFNIVANTWDTEEKEIQNKNYAEEIIRISGEKKFKDILEIGCGTGLLSAGFIKEDVNFFGVDTSAGMLEVFNKKFIKFKNVKSHLVNLETDSLDLENVDLIISSMAFHHLENPLQLLKKLSSKFNKFTMIAIIDLDAEDGSFHPDPKNMGVFHFGFGEIEMRSWAKELGFKEFIRKTVNIVRKNNKEYPICLNVFKN